MMFRHSLANEAAAVLIEKAVEKVLAAGYRTGDMMQDGLSRCSTSEMAEKVLAELQ